MTTILIVFRCRGSNPAVMASRPLNNVRNTFAVKIESRGEWIGIGFCDDRFVLHEGSTLGTQTTCINGSFFCQDNTTLRIQGTKVCVKIL